ncbi:MAG: phosphatase PAP2 family protein [Thermoanaerobaculia bacterium]
MSSESVQSGAAPVAQGRRSLPPLPFLRRPLFFEIFLLAQLPLVHLVFFRARLPIGPVQAYVPLISMVEPIVFIAAVALAGHLVASAVRRHARDYLRTIVSVRWLVLTARLMFFFLITIWVYESIKVTLPVTRAEWFDIRLSQIDRFIFGGRSPNEFLLTLFAWPPFLRFVDWSYAAVFQNSLFASLVVFLSLKNERVRVAFFTGTAVLWITGAWLYYLVPAMGPAYRFQVIWADLGNALPTTIGSQAALLRNFIAVLKLKEGIIDPSVHISLGIAAFPSLHVASVSFIALWVAALWRRSALVGALITAVIFVGSVVTGWHYLVDSLAGLVLGVLCFLLTFYGYRIPEALA